MSVHQLKIQVYEEKQLVTSYQGPKMGELVVTSNENDWIQKFTINADLKKQDFYWICLHCLYSSKSGSGDLFIYIYFFSQNLKRLASNIEWKSLLLLLLFKIQEKELCMNFCLQSGSIHLFFPHSKSLVFTSQCYY